MALYTYKAISADGRRLLGRIDALNLVDLEMRLKRMELDLISGERNDVLRLVGGQLKLARREVILDQAVLGTPNLAIFLSAAQLEHPCHGLMVGDKGCPSKFLWRAWSMGSPIGLASIDFTEFKHSWRVLVLSIVGVAISINAALLYGFGYLLIVV